MKRYKVYYHSRYYKYEKMVKYVYSKSKRLIRDQWEEITMTDEFVIDKIEEVKQYERIDIRHKF